MLKQDLRQIATALVGAVIFSTVAVVAAAGPVRAAAPLSNTSGISSNAASSGIGRAM